MIDIAIAHAAWRPERRESLARLVEELLPVKPMIFASAEPEHSSAWARRIWEWAAGSHADAVVILNDDITVHPDFVRIVEAMVEAMPGEILSLHAQGPQIAELAREGHRWVRAYDLTGPAYVFQRGHARELLDFWDAWPELQFAGDVNEDNVASQAAWSVQRPMLLSIPAIVKHDTSIPSTLGYDQHEHRNSSVPWEEFPQRCLTDVHYWDDEPGGNAIPLVENPWFRMADMERMRRARIQLRAAQRSGVCWWCGSRDAVCGSAATGALICGACVTQSVGRLAGLG